MRFSVLTEFLCGFTVLDDFFLRFSVSDRPKCAKETPPKKNPRKKLKDFPELPQNKSWSSFALICVLVLLIENWKRK